MNRLTIPRPDDWHLHLRDGDMLARVVVDTAAHFGRAIIMPNLVPPVITSADAQAYRSRILAALPAGSEFQPLMTLYLTETTVSDDVVAAAASGLISAVKLYPAGATTNSASGVRDFDKVTPVLEAMAENGIPLCVHGEVTDPDIDIFDREAVFLEQVLDPLRQRIRGLRVVLEHVTTCDGVDYVRQGGDDIAATITTHHLFINRNHILAGGIRPIIIAFLSLSGRCIVSRWLQLPLRVRVHFSLEPTVPRMLMQQNNLDVVCRHLHSAKYHVLSCCLV